jgi:hypothetical protein
MLYVRIKISWKTNSAYCNHLETPCLPEVMSVQTPCLPAVMSVQTPCLPAVMSVQTPCLPAVMSVQTKHRNLTSIITKTEASVKNSKFHSPKNTDFNECTVLSVNGNFYNKIID